jgi:hypothetical protein
MVPPHARPARVPRAATPGARWVRCEGTPWVGHRAPADSRGAREKLKSWNPDEPEARGEGRFPDSLRVDPLIRRAAGPRFAYTARDMGAAD